MRFYGRFCALTLQKPVPVLPAIPRPATSSATVTGIGKYYRLAENHVDSRIIFVAPSLLGIEAVPCPDVIGQQHGANYTTSNTGRRTVKQVQPTVCWYVPTTIKRYTLRCSHWCEKMGS